MFNEQQHFWRPTGDIFGSGKKILPRSQWTGWACPSQSATPAGSRWEGPLWSSSLWPSWPGVADPLSCPLSQPDKSALKIQKYITVKTALFKGSNQGLHQKNWVSSQQEKQSLPAILTPQLLKPEIINAATDLFWALCIHGGGCSWQNTVLVFKLLNTRWLFLPWTGEFPHFISAGSPDRSAVISAFVSFLKL